MTGVVLPIQAHEHEVRMFLSDFTLSGELGIVDWFGVELRLPVRLAHTRAIFRGGAFDDPTARDVLDGFGSIHHRTETLAGVGDLELRLRFPLLHPGKHKGWMLALTVGVAFPTGGIEENPYELGRAGAPHQHIFFGSGTFDPLANLMVGKRFRRWALLGWFDTRGAVYENRYGYRAGARILAGLGAQSGFGLRRWRFRVQTEVFHQFAPRWDGQRESEDGGRTDLVFGLGTRVQVHESWALDLLLRAPVTLDSVGAKVTLPVTISLGVEAGFKVF